MRMRRRAPLFLWLALVGVVFVPSVASADEPEPWRELCAKGDVVRGVDVSSWQGELDWKMVRAAGVRFAYLRVSDGATAPDPQFTRNWQQAARAGVLRGAYQFFRPAEDPLDQADLFLDAVGAPEKGDLPPALDIEVAGDQEPDELVLRIERWVNHVRKATSVAPVIYTSAVVWAALTSNSDRFQKLALWIAHHEVACPNTPSPWTRWTLHQSSAAAALDGIPGPIDLDVFHGTLRALDQFGLKDAASARAAWKRWRRAHPAVSVDHAD